MDLDSARGWTDDVTAIDDFFTHYYARRPVNATFTGVHAYDDALPDWSLDGLDALDDEMRSLGSALEAEYPAPASATAFRSNPDLLDAELARAFLDVQRAENASMHGPRGNPALWTGEAIFSIIALMIRDFAPVESRVCTAMERLQRIPEAFARLHGRAPQSWVAKAVRECDGANVLLSSGIERWLADATLPHDDAQRTRRLAAQTHAAFRALASQLDSMPKAPESAMSCGPDLFDLLLSRGHFCTRSRADLLADAKDRFEAARAELDVLARSVAGSWADAQIQLAADRPTPDEYFPAFERMWLACRETAERENVISWPDGWPIRYAPYPAWTADAAPYLYYLHYRSPAPFDPVAPYDYVVPPLPSDPEEADQHLRVWNHSTIKLNHVVHHGGIGHHVQNWYAYNQQRSRVGKVAGVDCANRIGMFLGGTMTEGWACYATDLMEELGFLTPLERVSQQHTRVRMLARAIVDIELHQGTMSFGEAVRFYEEQVGMGAAAAKGEAVKNSMFPCTAIMYWLGTQGIHDLRDEMKRREGPLFSLRRFHGELLGYGSIPVPLIARMMTGGQ
ncbi:MAG TPA: DUF885 family protein [Gemmatimonadaceae bacterium]|nr:DUF885 family protein [Gemmatimonadaceae bacterium]